MLSGTESLRADVSPLYIDMVVPWLQNLTVQDRHRNSVPGIEMELVDFCEV